MLKKVFIPSGPETMFSAKLAKYAVERKLSPGSSIKVEIIPDTPRFNGISLARFSAPERMAYTGQALVIGPAVFAIQDITALLNLDLASDRIAAAKAGDAWDTSVMLVDAEKLRDWKMREFLRALENDQVTVEAIADLSIEPDVLELPRLWNSLDKLTPETKLLHLTQAYPWMTGLPMTTAAPRGTFFGLELGPLEKFFSKKSVLYPKHPDKKIEAFFFDLMRSAYKSLVLDDAFIKTEMAAGRVRNDLLSIIKE